MKKVFSLLLALLVAVMPVLGVNAAEEKEKVKFYIFYGDGCGFCASLHSYTDELEKNKEYNEMFEIVNYEVWSNSTNATLMSNVGEYFGTKVTGVPFYVIGEKYFSGFSAESSPAQIEAAIKEAYEDKDYKDIVAGIGSGELTPGDAAQNENETNNNAVGYMILGITAIIVVAIIFGRSKESYYDDEEVEETEEVVEEPEEDEEVEEEPKKVVKKTKEVKAANKSTTTKKTTAKKETSKSAQKTTTKKSSTAKKSSSTKKKTSSKKK